MQNIKNAVNETAIKSTQIARVYGVDHDSIMIILRNIRESLPASYHADIELCTNAHDTNPYWLVSWALWEEHVARVNNNHQLEMIKRAA